MNETIEGEVISREIVPAQQSVTLFQTDDPEEVVVRATKIAGALANVIRKQKLATNIQGKEYVRVEGWTLLGSMLGVFPVETWTKPLENGWEARVEARRGDQVIGAAEAMCTRDEKRWKDADEYAIRSMAQTRATAKAMRLPLSFVMQLAGYAVTPAEEMDFARPQMRGGRQRPTDDNGTPVRAPMCKVEAHGACAFVPSGVSKATAKFPNGKPYESFWACQFPDCKEGWQGRKWSIKAVDWDDMLRREEHDQEPRETVGYDDLPDE
jgi:hypothetical protein